MNGNIQQTKLRDQVLEVLRFRLVSGEFEPDAIYSAVALAKELGVSPSPVREAMLTLVNQGLMEAVRNRGFRVAPVSERECKEIHQLRLLLEVPSMASLAGSTALKARALEFKGVVAELVACAERTDFVGYLQADRKFHLGILGLLENERLVQIVGNLREQTRHHGLRQLAARGELVTSAREHADILEAMLKGDSTLTAELMTCHLGHILRREGQ